MCLSPFALLFGGGEDERWCAEFEVWSRSLAVSKHGWVQGNRQESRVGTGNQAWVWLSTLAAWTDGTTTVAQAYVGNWASEHEWNAHSISTAWSCRARVELVAQLTAKASAALAFKLNRVDLDALASVQTWVRFAQHWQFGVDVTTSQVWVVHQHFRAVHDGEFTKSVADYELRGISWVSDQITWLRVDTHVIADASNCLLLDGNLLLDWELLLDFW